MTYDLIQTSDFSGEPVEIYEYNRDSEFWRYTTADEDVTFGGLVYESIPIERGGLETTGDVAKGSLKIITSRTIGLVAPFINDPPTGVINLIIRRFHQSDSDSESIIAWRGRLTNVSIQGDRAELNHESLFKALDRSILRRTYQRTCPHVLYGTQCRAIQIDNQITATLSFVSNNVLTSTDFSALPDGYFNGGWIEYTNARNSVDRRLVISHVGSLVTLEQSIIGLPSTASIVAIAGCDRLLQTCIDKFNNEDNYGGFQAIPDSSSPNPFNSSTSVF